MYQEIKYLIRFCFVFTFFFLAVTDAFAQHYIRGTVINSDSIGVEAANIRLLRVDSMLVSGTVSNSNGKFEIRDVESGKYILNVSHIEYKENSERILVVDKNIELENIIMQQDNKTLEEIHVVADRIIRKKEGMLIYPRKKDLKFAGSGYDILYNIMIPGIVVDRNKGSITRLGKEVTLYIDGQKVEYREIQNIEPNSIDKIEYIDMPTGKYIQDDIVINIITLVST